MDNIQTARNAISNMTWRFFERIGAQLVTFIVSVILARILMPEAYGVVAIISAFSSILSVFVDSGLGTALVQSKEVQSSDYSTVFYTNIFIAVILYSILFAVAPVVSSFFKISEYTSLIRVQLVSIIIASIKNVQQAYVARNLLFKKFFYSTLTGTIIAGIIGVTLAIGGCGAWALVCSTLINQFVDTLVLWFTVEWKPTKEYSFNSLKRLLGFGSKIFGASLIQSIYSNLYNFVIGKKYSSSDLAFFDKGKQIPELLGCNVDLIAHINITSVAISFTNLILGLLSNKTHL